MKKIDAEITIQVSGEDKEYKDCKAQMKVIAIAVALAWMTAAFAAAGALVAYADKHTLWAAIAAAVAFVALMAGAIFIGIRMDMDQSDPYSRLFRC